METLRTQSELRQHNHNTPVLFHCSRCGKDKPIQADGGTGYGYDTDDKVLCYQCCGEMDTEHMRKHGRITLYLGKDKDGHYYVGNWPSTLRIAPHHVKHGRHNIARTRTDVWFNFYGEPWHGVQYGEWTQICHCKRIKK